MDMRRTLLASAAALATFAFSAATANAQSALTGQVSSAEEGNMEGVVVSAKKDGSTITLSVVSDEQGRFAFPADRLDPGHYTVRIQAAGYELAQAQAVEVLSEAAVKHDLKLKKI